MTTEQRMKRSDAAAAASVGHRSAPGAFRSRRCFACIVAAAGMAAMIGCGGSRSGAALEPQAHIDAARESAEQSEAPEPRSLSLGQASDGAGQAEPMETVARDVAAGELSDVRVDPGSPNDQTNGGGDESSAGAGRVEEMIEREPIDAMIGQINGRPLYASEILGPMGARLRAEARRRDRESFLQFAREQINRALRDRVREELLLAEIESSLTPQQKQGLLHFVESLREDLVRGNLGSEELTERRLREQENVSLEQKVEQMRDRELIRLQLRRALEDRVHVSWRQVRQRYERDYEKYHPPASARLRVIRVPKSDQERIERVSEALEAGEPFAEVARRESEIRPEQGGLYERTLDGPTYAESRLFGPDEFNDNAAELEPGETVGPFPFRNAMVWIHLEDIERAEGQSLYDVQLQILQELSRERMAEEERQYFQELIDRSSLTSIREMRDRLFEIAAERYVVEERR